MVLGDYEGWKLASSTWIAALTDRERASLAFASLTVLGPLHRDMVIEALVGDAGMPGTPFLSTMDEAAFWADMSSHGELDAYALASFNRMTPARQSAFLD